MDRRRFIANMSAALVLLNGKTLYAADYLSQSKKKRVMRFVIGSDSHYGQKDTPYREYLETAVSRITMQHKSSPFDFAVINGECTMISVILEEAKRFYSLPMTYYIT
jgi:hypothetical protein